MSPNIWILKFPLEESIIYICKPSNRDRIAKALETSFLLTYK